ncbi:MAG: hypothetical protein WAV16_01155 [Candidatus Moraniibacteriota bacterium]
MQIVTTDKAVADGLNCSQSILPVKFVYMTDQGSIDNIWSNVGQWDDLYVIKFFSAKKTELPLDSELLSRYAQSTTRDIVELNRTQETKLLTIQDKTEEIITVV